MIYLSAQPARYYFIWQLEVQLRNFNSLGIKKEDIHILFSFKNGEKIDKRVSAFIENCNLALFYFYEDTRPESDYEPTIRPHLIKKHFNQFPWLEKEVIFYHDCDIIFKELPNFAAMQEDDNWYMSDTEDYLGVGMLSQYNINVLQEMIDIVGVEKSIVTSMVRSGGAQSVLKRTNYFFWDKVESDSNAIFEYLNSNAAKNAANFGKNISSDDQAIGHNVIQVWCADMWALLWNGLLFGNKIVVDPELDFCWPKQDISFWHKTKILHNAGVLLRDSHSVFFKGSFTEVSPFNINYDFIDQAKCSSMYVKAITDSALDMRTDLLDVSFAIIARIDSATRLKNLDTVIGYVNKHFKTNILVLEADSSPLIDGTRYGINVKVVYHHDTNPSFNRAKYNNLLLDSCETPIAFIQDADVIIDEGQIRKAVELIRSGSFEMVSPYNGVLVNISDLKIKDRFAKEYDIEILRNDRRAQHATFVPIGGSIAVNKKWYQAIGNENRLITGWGPDDIERVVRGIMMGGRFFRIDGLIYHLAHPRLENSGYGADFQDKFQPLVDLVNLSSDELEPYVNSSLIA